MDGWTLAIFAMAGVGAALWFWSDLIAPRVYRARLIRGYRDFEGAADGADLDEDITRSVGAVEDLGYRSLATLRSGEGVVTVVLHSDADGSVAEVVDMRTTKGVGRITVEFTSLLRRGSAVLCTGDIVVPSLHDDELRQAFPNTSPADLARYHHAALSHLREAGLPVEPIGAGEALDLRRQWIRKQRRWVERAPHRTVRAWVRGIQKRTLLCAGPIADSLVMQARVAALLRLS